MTDPVVAPDGYSYEKKAICKYLECSSRSPITRQPMSVQELFPNRSLAELIRILRVLPPAALVNDEGEI